MDVNVKCLVCDSSFEELTTSRDDDVEYHRKLDEAFQKYFCVESWDAIKSEFTRRISGSADVKSSSKRDRKLNSSDVLLLLPFCNECSDFMCQLSNLHENLLKIQTQINQIVFNANNKIIQTEKQRLEKEQTILDKELGISQNFLTTIIRSNIHQRYEQQRSSFHKVIQEKGKVPQKPIFMSTASQTDVIKIMIRADVNPEERRKAQEAKWELLKQQNQMGSSNAVNLNVDVKLNNNNNSQKPSLTSVPQQEVAIKFVGDGDGEDVKISQLSSEIQNTENESIINSIGQNKYKRPKSPKKIVPESKRRFKPQKVGDGEFSYNGILFNQMNDQFQCRECSKILKNHKAILKHIRYEHCPGDFQCPKCLRYFLTQNIVKLHGCKKQTQERQCKIIEIEPQKFTLNSFPFELDGETWKCGTCDSRLSSKKNMIDHVRLKHAGLYHECEICKRRFLWKASLESHLSAHSEDPSFLCPHCGKLFRTRGNMQTHVSFVHTKTRSRLNRRPPDCKQCNNMKFNSLWAYYNHKRNVHQTQPSAEEQAQLDEVNVEEHVQGNDVDFN